MKYFYLLSFCLLLVTASCGLLGGEDSAPDIPGKLVFAAKDTSDTYQIYTIKANGKGLKKLTDFPSDGGGIDPAWSPDGQRILFSNFTNATTAGPYLNVMDADGSKLRPLKKYPNSSIAALVGLNSQWSPDGSKIVYDLCVNCQLGTNYELFVYDIKADSVIRLTDNQSIESDPAWSPDGSRVAFTTDRDYFNADTLRYRKDIYVMNADGSGLKRLTDTGNAIRPVWSPDGSKIAYEWNIYGNQVFVYEFSLGQITKIDTGLQFSGNPQWNKQGTQLMVFGRETERSKPEMRLLNLEGSKVEVLYSIVLPEQAVGRSYHWFIPNDN